MPTNKDRANRAHWIINGYRAPSSELEHQDGDKEVLTDILVDFMHFANDNGLSFDDVLRMARIHHGEEIGLVVAYAPALPSAIPGDVPGMFWTAQYGVDDDDQVEIVKCVKQPTFGQIVAQFEHLQNQVDEGYLEFDQMNIRPYSGIPVIDPDSAPYERKLPGTSDVMSCEEVKSVPLAPKCLCQSCNKLWENSELNEMRDFWSRVQVGDIVPAGDCPECGAFCFPVGKTT